VRVSIWGGEQEVRNGSEFCELTGLDFFTALAFDSDGLLAEGLAGLDGDGGSATDGGGTRRLGGTHHLEGHLQGERGQGCFNYASTPESERDPS